ncbi:unnamed protein product [Bursaphelenchus xylophilus]|uniref:Long-chain-fatty-acid--CoA ligase n=1 Tax=Bursaphelenchus xylophilus TaxID=6326 RepID=A0A1I7SSU3_BURXY|nr:unnamed protein product [Bursaphelenchus xylophilus]CAG9108879.1 unnamed protein product [Bursaphelenchus xylophilus]
MSSLNDLVQNKELISGTLFTAFLGGIVVAWLTNRRSRIATPKGVSRDRQAVPVEGEVGLVLKSGLLAGEKERWIETIYPEATTLYQLFLRGLEVSGNRRCLGYRVEKEAPYTFISYAETFRRARNIGSAFISYLGVDPGNKTLIGIYAQNCPEWTISCIGAIRYSMVTVPLYDTLGADAAKFIVKDTGMQIIVVDNGAKVQRLLSTIEETPSLKHIVVIKESEVTSELLEEGTKKNVKIHTFSHLLHVGETDVQPDVEPTPDDMFIICYTSGTTGTPKGVVLNHRNLVANVSGVIKTMRAFLPETESPDQVSISYLPLSHMFEQVCHWCLFALGGSVGYFRGDVRHLNSDMKALKPTIFPTVPRLLNRFYGLIQKQLQDKNPLKRALLKLAYNKKLSHVKAGIIENDSIWDRLVFNKFQAELGGNLKFTVTGSAPISEECLEACRAAFGCHILEGYGQTECTAMATMTWPGEIVGGHCGGPAICSNIKLEDVAELNYFAKDRKGEVLIKGPCVTTGYFNNPEKTAELFDEQGYLHTGDIGHILPNGTLKIIDRKKHIFKLAQGEYVAPEKIENVYVQSNYVQQAYVDGDSLEPYLVAVIVPEAKELIKWYKAQTGEDKSLKEICEDQKVVDHVFEQVIEIGKKNKLNSIEQVKKIWLESEPFSVENGLLTPTFKSKRPQLRQKYKQVFDKLYGK